MLAPSVLSCNRREPACAPRRRLAPRSSAIRCPNPSMLSFAPGAAEVTGGQSECAGRLSRAEARGKIHRKRYFGMKRAGAFEQRGFGFGDLRVGNAAIDRACGGAFLVVEEADTFGAFVGRDVIDVLGDWRMSFTVEFPGPAAFINRIVGASRQAGAAIDAFLGNDSRHFLMVGR